MSDVTELVEALRSLRLGASDPPLEDVAALLAERAPILDAILALDPQTLSAAAQDQLKEALEEAQSHDRTIVKALEATQSQTVDALDRLVEARGTARAYRGPTRSKAGSVLRTA